MNLEKKLNIVILLLIITTVAAVFVALVVLRQMGLDGLRSKAFCEIKYTQSTSAVSDEDGNPLEGGTGGSSEEGYVVCDAPALSPLAVPEDEPRS